MNEVTRKRSQMSHGAGDAEQKPETGRQARDSGGDPHRKGTMREPAQIPSGTRGEQEEAQQALEELEKEKGDWSKGG